MLFSLRDVILFIVVFEKLDVFVGNLKNFLSEGGIKVGLFIM